MSKLSDRLYNTDAIILRRSDFGEADRLLTVFTVNRGKQRFVAKGIRKTKSRKAGHLELFMHTTMQIAKGKNLDIITQADIVEAFRALREDLDKISQAYYLSELIDRFTEEGDASFPIFELLALTLARINDGDIEQQYLALRYFEVILLNLAGYRPELFVCLGSGQPIKEEDNYFSIVDGGVFSPAYGEQKAQASLISVGALKVLRFMQTRTWDHVVGLQLTPKTQTEVQQLLLRYITFILERNLKSVDFLKKLAQ